MKQRQQRVSVIFWALFVTVLPNFPGRTAQVPDSSTTTKQIEMSGRDYWYHQAFFSSLKSIGEEDGNIIGEVRTKHGFVTFIAKKADVSSLTAKTEGYILACESLISILTYGQSEEKISAARERLTDLTGRDFPTAEQWQRWLGTHRERLMFSNAKGRLDLTTP